LDKTRILESDLIINFENIIIGKFYQHISQWNESD
jgi:hypothetical protein